MTHNWSEYREKIIGLGEQSSRKSYYPELQEKIRELEISQANLQTIINSTNDGIVIHDAQGIILSFNQQAQKIFNISEDEMEAYTIFDISSDKMDKRILIQKWEEVLNLHPIHLEWLISQPHTKDEIPVQISFSKTLWYKKVAMVAVVRDFTERKKYEEELVIARQKAEENDRLKSVFLSNLSHEIRTPMNAIMGFADLLKDSSLPENQRNTFVDTILKSGDHLLSIITDIIEISKIETNQIRLKYAPLDITHFVTELYNIFRIMNPSNNLIELILKIPDAYNNSLMVVTDEVKLRQIIINLISNAFKFTKKGIIEFGFEVSDELFFFVRDTGIGIDSKYHQIIFERFRRIEDDFTIEKGGSGLGLAISKAYVEMLGGTITLESKMNEGSFFKFSIPLNR